jgi:hypothetical protein
MVPGATPSTAVISPPPPANVPLKPVSSTPASVPEPSSKTGTSIVKAAPPKETARITVKPNLPPTPVRAAGNFPIAKPAAGAVPAVAVAAGVAAAGVVVAAKAGATKPATTIVKTGTTKVASPTVKPAVQTATPALAVPAIQYQEEGSTTLTTVLAGLLALLTWGTAGVLIASYLALI